MLSQDLFRSGRWHSGALTFGFTNGPDAVAIGNNSVTIGWELAPAGTGQVEYGLTTSLGLTSTEETDYLEAHLQSISGLQPNTTYYYRVKSVSEAGVTLYSAIQSFQTTGQAQSPDIGPQYDFIGGVNVMGGPSLGLPSFPSIGGSVVLVPADCVNNATNLNNFLNNTSEVPNGTTVVFDRTEGGAGTVYNLSRGIRLHHPGSVRSNITLFGYNVRIVNNSSQHSSTSESEASCFNIRFGGWRSLAIKGFEIEGSNPNTGTWGVRSGSTEQGHGIRLYSGHEDLVLEDLWIHNVRGDGIYMSGQSTSVVDPTLAFTDGIEIGHCYISGTTRQGVVPNQGRNWDLHHSVIEDTALRCIDAEDDVPQGSPRVMSLTVRQNILRRWNWHLTGPLGSGGAWRADCIAFTHIEGELEDYGPITITGNSILEGARGYGDPDAEQAVLGGVSSGGEEPIIDCPTAWRNDSPAHDLTVTDNIVDLDPDQAGPGSGAVGNRGEFLIAKGVHNLTVSGNQTAGKPVYHTGTSGTVSISHDGAVLT